MTILTKKRKKSLKKKFFPVEIPLLKKQEELQAYALEELDGKVLKIDLTRELRGKSIELTFNIKVKRDKAIALPKKLVLMSFFLKRVLRKGTNYIEDSFSTKCKDAQIRIKPFLITRKKVSREVRKTLRTKTKETLIEELKNKKFEEIIDDILKNRIQKPLSLKLKKIYPLSLCEIKMLIYERPL